MLDTLAIARALTAADFTPGQADAITDAVRQAAAGVDVETLATKDDIAALERATKDDLRTEIAALGSAMKALEHAMKTDMAALERTMKADLTALERAMKALERAAKADLRVEIAALELRLVKWIVGTGLAVAGLVVAGVVTALRLLG